MGYPKPTYAKPIDWGDKYIGYFCPKQRKPLFISRRRFTFSEDNRGVYCTVTCDCKEHHKIIWQ